MLDPITGSPLWQVLTDQAFVWFGLGLTVSLVRTVVGRIHPERN